MVITQRQSWESAKTPDSSASSFPLLLVVFPDLPCDCPKG